MMQRLEGDDWKVIIMTRWGTNDLAGRVLDAYPDVEHITFKAVQDDGSMLAPSILNRGDFELKTQEMNADIVQANYNQQPIDIKGRLYSEFTEYEAIPEGKRKRFNYTDTADKGIDFLCSIDYEEVDGDVYVTDVEFTDEGMEVTEPAVARMLHADGVDEATVESNNGGRGFARNVERELKELGNRRCVVKWVAQTQNKEARILASSAWVNRHVFMPRGWKQEYPEYYRQLMSYQKKGRNKHDDGPDVLAAIYERVANPRRSTFRVRTA
jgi:predicted phage terminase large subunit-like protein